MKATSILLVEDDPEDQWFFIEVLHEIKNTTLFCVVTNGREALDKLLNSAILPAVIFTDVNMPLMSGIELLAAIAKQPRLHDVPVVMLSTDTGKKELAYQLGAKDFIKKTSDFKSLREQMEQVINDVG